MDWIDLPTPPVIVRENDLQQLAEKLLLEPIIAVDTESNSLHAYQEQVCLIQFSTPEEDYLVDPLELVDLSALEPVFANPDVEKVFHAAEYDLICLKRDFNFDFHNLFDTMIAASILGWDEVGLGAILQKEFGVTVDKRFQRADWGQRPLPPELLSYARLDTHFLIELRNRLKAELEENGRWSLAQEDFHRLAVVAERTLENSRNSNRQNGENGEGCFRISGSHELTPQQNAVLQELCRYRDQVARHLNRPLFKVINDETLLAIASTLPTSLEDLRRLRGMSQGQVRRHGRALLQAVQRGLNSPPVYPSRNPRPDEQFLNRLESLKRWRKNTAQKFGVKSDVILPRDLLYRIAEANPSDYQQLARVLANVPWRLQEYGPQILKTLTRRAA